jgi:hypothetical protein
VWWGEAVDVTKPVVDVYNAQSGVAPPPASSATPAKPAASKPAGTTTKSATPVKPADVPK